MSIQPYSFKIIIHTVTLQGKENKNSFLVKPSVSITLGSFPRLLINSKNPISGNEDQYKLQTFGHGKSALIKIDQEKLK